MDARKPQSRADGLGSFPARPLLSGRAVASGGMGEAQARHANRAAGCGAGRLRPCPVAHLPLPCDGVRARSEEHTSELQSLMRISYAVFCLKKKMKLNI